MDGFHLETPTTGPHHSTQCRIYFSYVAYVWVYVQWSKNYWANRKKVWFFLNLIFMAATRTGFQTLSRPTYSFAIVISSKVVGKRGRTLRE
jgi:hypothetical protein